MSRTRGDHACEHLVVLLRVGPVAVGRLDQDHVGARGRRRWQERWMPGSAEVAAHRDAHPVHVELGVRRAQDVPCTVQLQPEVAGQHRRSVVLHRSEQRDRALGVCGVEQGQRGFVRREGCPVGVRRVLLLQVGSVSEHDLHQRRSPRRACTPLPRGTRGGRARAGSRSGRGAHGSGPRRRCSPARRAGAPSCDVATGSGPRRAHSPRAPGASRAR